MEKFANRIKEIMVIEDEDERRKKAEEVLCDLTSFLKDEKYFIQAELICNLKIDMETKLRFFMLASQYKGENKPVKSMAVEIIPKCFFQTIKERNNEVKEEFLTILTNNLEFQKEYTYFFKQFGAGIYQIKECYDQILALPMFKEYVLKDENFISNYLSRDYEFYENLPKEFGYLITLLNSIDYERIKYLYKKYLEDTLTKEQQEELAQLQYSKNSSPNIFGLNTKERMIGLTTILKRIYANKDFYSNMKYIQNKIGLDLKSMISFTYKYYNTELYNQLFNMDLNIDQNTKEKIQYLAKEDRITNINNIADIMQHSIEQLRGMKKERRKGVKTNLIGGALAKTKEHAFFDSANRELRAIFKNGKVIKLALGMFDDHDEMVKNIYREYMVFPENCIQANERMIKAAEVLSSITYLIEQEQCCITIPSDLTMDQKKISREWIKLATDKGVFGINVFDRELEDFYMVDEGDAIDRNRVLEVILELGEKTTEEELDQYSIKDGEMERD